MSRLYVAGFVLRLCNFSMARSDRKKGAAPEQQNKRHVQVMQSGGWQQQRVRLHVAGEFIRCRSFNSQCLHAGPPRPLLVAGTLCAMHVPTLEQPARLLLAAAQL